MWIIDLLLLVSGLQRYWTKNGCKIFGRLLKRSRTSRGLTLRDIEDQTASVQNGSYKIDRNTLSILEGGRRIPSYNQVGVLAEIGVMKAQGDRAFTLEELSDILAEHLDPDTGWYKLSPNESPSIAVLIEIELQNRSRWLGLAQLAEDTGLTTVRLIQLLEGDRPLLQETSNLALGLRKNIDQHWSTDELQKL